MKKILFVALAATLLAAGCQKTELINRVGDKIDFSTEMGKLTKADGDDVDELATLKAQDFQVWVYTAYTDKLNNVEPGAIYDGMSGLEISDNTSGTWGPTNATDYYWPGKENNLEFYGISTGFDIVTDKPEKDGDPAVNTVITPGANRNIVITGYTVTPTTATDDLMIADFVTQNQTSDNNSRKVTMNFRHALSKVTFAFNTTGDKTVKVSKLEVTDLVVNGVLTASEDKTATATATATTTPITLSWNTKPEGFVEDTDDFTRTFEEAKQTLATGDHVPFTTWLVVPQALEGKTVKIWYSIGDKEFTHIFSLASTSLPNGWEVNQSVTYKVSLSPNTITFDATVSPWEEDIPVTEVN